MGKDPDPLTEVELLAESLMDNAGVFRPGKVVKWVPEVGDQDRIR
ncbi:hypothetical protein ACVGVM_10350 [Pseudonocardia bannensis]|nr:hypothetical protein [Pseudonocardia bannensis]